MINKEINEVSNEEELNEEELKDLLEIVKSLSIHLSKDEYLKILNIYTDAGMRFFNKVNNF